MGFFFLVSFKIVKSKVGCQVTNVVKRQHKMAYSSSEKGTDVIG